MKKFKASSYALPYVIYCSIFVVLPLILIAVYAFKDSSGNFTLGNFLTFVQQPLAINVFIYSIGIAMLTTLICILLGYPAAYILSHRELGGKEMMLLLFILPMWVNMLIRTLATVSLFDILNIPLGQGALLFGLVYDFLPFMIFPIYNTMQKIDNNLVEAAEDLGANHLQVFLKVILPLSLPGVVTGITMVFLPTISTFAISELLTMNNIRLFGSIIQENIMLSDTMNYGAALSFLMLIIIGATSFLCSEKDNAELNEGGIVR
ncbi:MAG TPA: spermidine/putrescine ABC transporter permease [Porphyromonadaceae bacterium]|nr:spermidine/putrescine ABC transporter permease [Porphyromonadaceae bacterium]